MFALRGVCVCLLLCLAAPASARAEGLRGAEGLAHAYALIFDADFDAAAAAIEQACPPAPDEACLTLEATRQLWRIQIDPGRLDRDAAFAAAVERAIAAAEAWTDREPERAEAWFYAGAAYGVQAQWRVLRHEQVSAARDGKRAKTALETALRLEPTLADAQFGLGLYEYYADVAPTAAKLLRFLLALPGGDRARGLARMREAHAHATLVADEAAYQIHLVLLWYENRAREALELLEGLSARHPRNPFFVRLAAETLSVYLHDETASRDRYRDLLERATKGAMEARELGETEARLGLATALAALGDTDLAVEQLEAVMAAQPSEPWGAVSRAQLALGRAYDRLGEWSKAEALFTAVVRTPPSPDPLDLAAQARRALQRPTAFSQGEAHRLALHAWRRFERTPSSEVEPLFERALKLDASNVVARYRYGVVLAAHGQRDRALLAFDAVVRAAASAPPAIAGDAALAAGRLREARGDTDAAAVSYRRAAYLFGAAAATRDEAARALARLAPQTPARPRRR